MWRDLRFALRTVVRQPVFAGIVILTVALGIGGSTAVFSVVNAVLLRDLPYPEADRLYVMRALGPDGLPGNITNREFTPVYLREEHPVVETAAIAWSQESQIVGADKQPHPTVRYGVTDRFFEVFGTRMALGRGFEPGESPGRIVISHQIWRDVFASDPDILGKAVSAEGMTLQVLGVTPAEFTFPENPGFWYLMRLGTGYDNVRAYRGFMRVRSDRTPAQLRSEAARLAGELGPDPVTGTRPTFVAQPFLEYVVGDLRATVMILFGATGILLLMACINATNLLLSRTNVRSREVALREAVGAGRWRMLRQLLTESVLLTALGGALGVTLAGVAIPALLAIAPRNLPRLDAVPIDASVLLFALGVTLLAGVLVGVAPALRLARNDLRTLINEDGRGTPGGPARNRLFSVLVITEIALAVVLVIGAGLLVRSYLNLTATDPGFEPERTLVVSMNVPGRIQSTMAVNAKGERELTASYAPMAAFFRELEERVRGISGVESVASTTSLPLTRAPSGVQIALTLPDQPGPGAEAAYTSALRAISPELFETMGRRIVSGRSVSRADRQGSTGAAVVNEAFARRYLPGQNPLGQRVRWLNNRYIPTDTGFQFGHLTVEEAEIVGVVADARYESLALPADPSIYMSSEQFIFRRRTLVVRTALDNPESVVTAIRAGIAAMDPLVGGQFALFETIVRDSLARERLSMTLLVVFGSVALLLAAVGVYGLMSYSVAQRTAEMAVRSAMGSSAIQILTLVLTRGVRLAATGILLGAGGAIALRQVVASQLYGVSALDVPVFLVVTSVLFAVAALACVVPALRATRVNPADLLRTE